MINRTNSCANRRSLAYREQIQASYKPSLTDVSQPFCMQKRRQRWYPSSERVRCSTVRPSTLLKPLSFKPRVGPITMHTTCSGGSAWISSVSLTSTSPFKRAIMLSAIFLTLLVAPSGPIGTAPRPVSPLERTSLRESRH